MNPAAWIQGLEGLTLAAVICGFLFVEETGLPVPFAPGDLLLAIGTSLSVYPVANTVPLAKSAGARVIILNAEPTPMDDMADSVLRGPIGELLPRLVKGRLPTTDKR